MCTALYQYDLMVARLPANTCSCLYCPEQVMYKSRTCHPHYFAGSKFDAKPAKNPAQSDPKTTQMTIEIWEKEVGWTAPFQKMDLNTILLSS